MPRLIVIIPQFGLHFGSRGVAGHPESLTVVARKAEALGYEHFGMSDHVIVATNVESSYPYSETGKFFDQDSGVSLEQVTALGFVAGVTKRIRLLTSVLVLPHRPPVLAAKMLSWSINPPSHAGGRTRPSTRYLSAP